MTDQPTDARERLLAHFSKAQGSTEHGQQWDALWKDNFLPWDKGAPNPALVDLLSERQDLLPPPLQERRKKALVPGCGKGYDVLLLAAHGYDAYGLEISGTALTEARKVEKQMSGAGVYQHKDVEPGLRYVSMHAFCGLCMYRTPMQSSKARTNPHASHFR